MEASRIAAYNIDEVIEDLVGAFSTVIADFRAMGLTDLTYDQLAELLYAGVSDRLQARGMSRQTTAVFMGKSRRDHLHRLQQYRERKSQSDATKTRYWSVASHIHEHPGITRGQLLYHFFDIPEEHLLSILSTLKANEVLFEGSGRGDTTKYIVQTLDFPWQEPTAFRPKLRNAVRGVTKAINAVVETEVLGREREAFLVDIEYEEEFISPLPNQIQVVLDKCIEELRSLWEQSEAKKSGKKSKKIKVFLGYVSEDTNNGEKECAQ